MIIQVAYTNGNFDKLEGKSLSIHPIPPHMVVVKQEHQVIFVGNLQDIRYIKEKKIKQAIPNTIKNERT
jgi:hypothetical protein